MLIHFDQIQESVIKNFNGGNLETRAHMFVDDNNRIMYWKLIAGASIGLHQHETGSEILYVLHGNGKAIFDGQTEELKEGMCHYCPKGHTHSIMNDGKEDLIFFTVVAQQ